MATPTPLSTTEISRTADETQEDVQVLPPIRSSRLRPMEILKIALTAAVPLLAICFGGTREPWVLASVLLLAGLLVTLFPMRARVHRLWIYLGSALLILAGYQLIPGLIARWNDFTPHMYSLLQLTPTPTLSLQPWVSLEQWLGLFGCVVWWWWCMSQNYSEKHKRLAIQIVSVSLAALAIAALIVKFGQIHVPWWRVEWDYSYFGPFPNRNHFSALLASAAILLMSTAFDAFHRRKRSYLFFSLAIVPIFAAILVSNSRAAIVLFFIGVGFWMFAGRFQGGSFKRMTLMTSALLFFATTFAIFGSKLMNRFTEHGDVISTFANETRWSIYQSSLELWQKSPVTGIGLGNFEPAYALYKDISHLPYRTLHPESDWIQLGIEAGLPALLVGLGIMVMILIRSEFFRRPSATRKSHRRLRIASCIAVAIFAIHGIFDVPMHHLGNALLVGLFAAIALPQRQSDAAQPEHSIFRWILPGLGTLVALGGTVYLLNASSVLSFPSSAQFKRSVATATEAASALDFAQAQVKLDEALKFKPLEWNLHFQKGIFELRRMGSPQAASLYFARARALERQHILICFKEGDTWLGTYPAFSMPAWRAILNRSEAQAPQNYDYILGRLKAHPTLLREAKNFARTPKLQLVYLLTLEGEEFLKELSEYQDSGQFFASLSGQERYRFFEAWYQRGNRHELLHRLRENKSWTADGWSFLCLDYADRGEYEAAYQLARQYVRAPFVNYVPDNVNETDARRMYHSNPNDLARGLVYYETLVRAAKFPEALALVLQLEHLPERPNKIFYDIANAYSKMGDYPKAYQSLMEYHRLSEQAP